MHAYVLVAAKPGRAIPTEVLRRLDEREPGEVPFVVDDHICWSNSTGRIAFGGWQGRADILGLGSHWHADEGGLTAFTGRLWPHGGTWRAGETWARQLADHVRRRPIDSGSQPMDGVYTAVSIDNDGRGTITTDPLAIAMVYRAETDDLVAYASRPGLAASVVAPPGRPPERDVFGVGWLIFTDSLIGDRTGYSRVRVLPVGAVVELHPRFGSHVRAGNATPWSADRDLPTDLEPLVELLHRDLSERVTSIAALPIDRPVADLTGGKDSRLVLALMIEADVAQRFRFRTFGAPEAPDATVARELAEDLGLHHEPIAPLQLEPDLFVRRLAVHTYQTSGMVSAWDLGGGLGVPFQPVVSGLYAEVMRTHFSALPPITTIAALRDRVSDPTKLDAGSILHRDVRARYARIRDDELFERIDSAASTPQDRLDAFFVRNRLRRWSGTTEEVGNNAQLYPLYSLLGLQAGFVIGDRGRRDGLLHLEVMRRAHPDLARRRFAGAGWPDSVLAHLPDPDDHRVPPYKAPPRTQPQWQATRLREQHAVVRSYLLDDPANPLFDIVDRRALARLIAGNGPGTHRERLQAYGALTAAVWLGRHELPAKVGTPRDELPRISAPDPISRSQRMVAGTTRHARATRRSVRAAAPVASLRRLGRRVIRRGRRMTHWRREG